MARHHSAGLPALRDVPSGQHWLASFGVGKPGNITAELTKLTGSGFHFAVVGAPPGDQVLDFKKG